MELVHRRGKGEENSRVCVGRSIHVDIVDCVLLESQDVGDVLDGENWPKSVFRMRLVMQTWMLPRSSIVLVLRP